MSIDPQTFINSMIEAQMVADHDSQQQKTTKPVIALSRDYGSGGTGIARQLGEQLGVQVYDRELLDAISHKANVDPSLMEPLDERISHQRSDQWIRTLLTGQDISQNGYRYHLINVLLALLPGGGVVMGRGAHIVLANRPVFRVRVISSETTCAERVAGREGITYQEAERKVRKINEERARFVWELFGHRLNDSHRFDLVVNTDHVEEPESCVDVILKTMQINQRLKQRAGKGGGK